MTNPPRPGSAKRLLPEDWHEKVKIHTATELRDLYKAHHDTINRWSDETRKTPLARSLRRRKRKHVSPPLAVEDRVSMRFYQTLRAFK